jgi:adenylate cyclase, class 2
MQTEFEVKFLGVDPVKLEEKIIENWGIKTSPMTAMRRVIFFDPNQKLWSFFRVRDEGNRVTMTYKKITSNSIDGVKEINLTIDDFDNGVAMLLQTWLEQKAYQESRRAVFDFNECEVVIDERPWLRPLCEIEWPSIEVVTNTAQLLWFDMNDSYAGTIDVVYELELGISPEDINNNTPVISFINPPMKR